MFSSERYDLLRYYSFRSAHDHVSMSDGDQLYFIADISGKPEIWRLDRPGGFPEQVTFLEYGVSNLKPWNDRLLFQMDVGGSEEYKIAELNRGGSIRVILDEEGTIFRLGEPSSDGSFSFSSNSRDRRCFDSYLRRADGSVVKVLELEGTSLPLGFDFESRRLLVSVSNSNLDNDIFLVELAESGPSAPRKIVPHREEALFQYCKFGKDDLVYFASNLGGEFLQPMVYDPSTAHTKALASGNWDVCAMDVSRDGLLAFARNADGSSDLTIFGPDFGKLYHEIFEGVISELKFTPGKARLDFVYSDYGSNQNIRSLELGSKSVTALTRVSPGHPGPAVKPELIRYETFDGRKIPCFVYSAPSGTNQLPPVVVYVHGGPESQKTSEYDGQIQFFLSRGLAVLTPNVRGSTGYGKSYVHLDDVEKRLDSVKDLAWLAKWIRASGRFDAERVCVMGRSYGGYMVLASLAFFPEYWRCGVESVGIANFESFLRNTSVWRRKLREVEYGSLERDTELFRQISPIHFVDRIRAPLLVQHGTNDPRVPIDESRQIVHAIKSRGGYADLVVFENEGHMNQNLSSRIKWAERVWEFLKLHLLSNG